MSSRIRRAVFVVALVNLICVFSAFAQESATRNVCAAAAPFAASPGPQWNGWGAAPTQQRFQSADGARLTADAVPRLKLKWAFGFPGAQAAYGQPAIAGNRLFVGSADGTVYALAADIGCQHWAFKASAQVRTAISVGKAGDTAAIFFGDQQGNAYAVSAATGALLWKVHVDDHPAARITGAPTLVNGVLYVPTSSAEEGLAASPMYSCCTYRGTLSALNASSGAVIWKSYTIAESPKPTNKNKAGTQMFGPSGAGIWSSPTVNLDRGMVFVTTGDSYSDPVADTSDAFIAFDLKTGKLLWSRQMTAGDAFTVDCDFPEAVRGNCPNANGPDFDFGSSAVLVNLGNGKRALIAGQKSGVVHAINPDRGGEILWQRKIGQGGRIGGIQWGISADATHVYAALSDVQMMAPPPDGKGGQPTFFGVPLMLNPDAGGGLYALDLQDRRHRLEDAASRLQQDARLQPRAVGGHDSDSGCGVLRRTRRPLARVRHDERSDRVGRRYDAKVRHGQPRRREGWVARRLRSGRRQRNRVCELGLHLYRAHTWKRAAGVFSE